MYMKEPMEIERKSFEIIEKEWTQQPKSYAEEQVMKRIIHTTGDFEYGDLLRVGGDGLEKGLAALKPGFKIYSDTKMIQSGINKTNLQALEGTVYNATHDEDVAIQAKKEGRTRSMVGIEKAVKNEDIQIFVIGNAPTALFHLLDLLEERKQSPALIIGVPVGFVGAEESKEALMKSPHPYLAVKGRKGGSPVAAAMVNALMKIKVQEADNGRK